MGEADCLALELVEAAFDFGGVPYECGRAVPIRGGRIEDPRKIVAVGRGGKALGHRQNRDLVDRRLGDQLECDPGRIGRADYGLFTAMTPHEHQHIDPVSLDTTRASVDL
jgi:hypothetical protein